MRLQATVFLVYGFAAATSSLLQKYFPPAVALSPLVAIAIVVASALSHRRSPLAE